ncbi:MAG: pseudouridine synthase [Cyanobacteria bacterium P01_A01_bin.84]
MNNLFPNYLQEVSDFLTVDFIDAKITNEALPVSYEYQGYCHQTGELVRLPRTKFVEELAGGLMGYLAGDEFYSREGKMYGILLVELFNGEKKILRAFSGLLNGCRMLEGWVPPIDGKELVEWDENLTLQRLEDIKQEIATLKKIPERQQYESLALDFRQNLQQISSYHQECKRKRQEKRLIYNQILKGKALNVALEQLDEESRQQGITRKLLKRDRDRVLKPLKQLIGDADTRIGELKRQRKELSRQLQTQMHTAYSLMNFFGRSQTLQELIPGGLPTGTGECCAPKLLHYAATHNLKPLAMAEFWWGSSEGDKIQGEFYGACTERCQPLMGFLLSGLHKPKPLLSSPKHEREVLEARGEGNLPIIYEDEWLIAIDKPSGLLSVPGRYFYNQNSVVSRLRNLLADGKNIKAIHRLDRDTSGILLLAKDIETHRLLSQQFEKREIEKLYQAVLCGCINKDNGIIELPLWGNPNNRPYQEVNWQYGKPCITEFKVIKQVNKQVLKTEETYTHIEFKPLTGRTHQLRIHAADKQGLNAPILGDKLYGDPDSPYPLHLHAQKLQFVHPYLGKELCLELMVDNW